MTISSIFPRAKEAGEPWSAVLLGMVASFKPAAKPSASSSPPALHHASTTSVSNYHDGPTYVDASVRDHDDLVSPPSKRRKLHESAASKPRPPTKLTRRRPDGDLLSTTNAVSSVVSLSRPNVISGTSSPPTKIAEPSAQPAIAEKEDKRTLRSQDDGPKLRSELAIYFPNYEEMVSKDDQRQPSDAITPSSLLCIQRHAPSEPDDVPQPTPARKSSRRSSLQIDTSKRIHQPWLTPVSASPSSRVIEYDGFQVVDLGSFEKSAEVFTNDPMADDLYQKAHKRAERREKQLRNIEKERAMHEKVQLERILQGLEGHDWLRVLGVTGVTDSEARRYEGPRMYFVQEVRALVEKFKRWKQEEKRLKTVRDSVGGLQQGLQNVEAGRDDNHGATVDDENVSMGPRSRVRLKKSISKAQHQVQPPPRPEMPFTSFFSKPHLRAAAVGKQRHGRTSLAFGLPIPELQEHDFILPSEYTTPEALKESARRRRRMNRESLANAKSR